MSPLYISSFSMENKYFASSNFFSINRSDKLEFDFVNSNITFQIAIFIGILNPTIYFLRVYVKLAPSIIHGVSFHAGEILRQLQKYGWESQYINLIDICHTNSLMVATGTEFTRVYLPPSYFFLSNNSYNEQKGHCNNETKYAFLKSLCNSTFF